MVTDNASVTITLFLTTCQVESGFDSLRCLLEFRSSLSTVLFAHLELWSSAGQRLFVLNILFLLDYKQVIAFKKLQLTIWHKQFFVSFHHHYKLSLRQMQIAHKTAFLEHCGCNI